MTTPTQTMTVADAGIKLILKAGTHRALSAHLLHIGIPERARIEATQRAYATVAAEVLGIVPEWAQFERAIREGLAEVPYPSKILSLAEDHLVWWRPAYVKAVADRLAVYTDQRIG